MKALHISWSKPMLDKIEHPENYTVGLTDDYYILTQILSALKWREKNGSIKLYTDKFLGNYIKEYGIDEIYDLGVDYGLDNYIPDNFDAVTYWAGAKLFALKREPCPVTIIDTDLIVWENITSILTSSKVCVSHREMFHPVTYLKKNEMYCNDSYSYDNLDFTVLPCNTSIVHFNDDSFKNYYCDKAIEYMLKVSPVPYPLNLKSTYMCFAEQRILAMCCKEKGINPFCFLSLNNPENYNSMLTHIWSYKQNLISNKCGINNYYCKNIINIIKNEFPKYFYILENIPSIRKYLNNYNKE